MIKREMLIMQHYDGLFNPTSAQQGLVPGRKAPILPEGVSVVNQEKHTNYLQTHPYERVDEKDLQKVNYIFMLVFFETAYDLSGTSNSSVRNSRWNRVSNVLL